MQLTMQDKQYLVASGNAMEMLRLRAELAKRDVEYSTINRSSIQFKGAVLPIVSDLFPNIDSPDVLEIFNGFNSHQSAVEAARAIRDSGVPTGVPLEWLDVLDPPQAMAVAELIQEGMLGVCLFDEQGSGKTVMSIAAFDILMKNEAIDAMIVVCPKAMVGEWPKDINRFTRNTYKTLVADGDAASRRELAFSHFDVLVVGYEGLSTILQGLISGASARRYLLVADESFFVKNEDASRSETIAKLRVHCSRCFVLCGTPAPNSPHDLVNQMNLADRGYAFGGFSKSRSIDGDRERISELLEHKGYYIRRLKSDILEYVPDKKFHIYKIAMTGRQAKMYEEARSNLELELINLGNQKFKRSIASYLQKRAVLLQICSCPQSIDPSYSDTPAKYRELDTIVENLFAEGKKLIIWSFYRSSIDEILSRYKTYLPLRIDGSVSGDQRKEAVNLFQNDPGRLLLVANPAAAGAGITLHAAHNAAYFSYSNKAADYLQSLDRIHRRGQVANEVNYYLFVCENTIEENEIKRLRAKELSQNNLLGDYTPWPTSFDDALAELKGHG